MGRYRNALSHPELESLRMRARDTSSVSYLEGLSLGPPLGQGGMSRVREAATAEGRRVAVKFPRLDDASHAAARALVHREYGFLDGISHPNVVAVFGLTRTPDWPDAPAAGPAARGKSPPAFDRRGIPADCVARRSNIPDILPPRALSAGRRAGLGATGDFCHGLLAAHGMVMEYLEGGDLVSLAAAPPRCWVPVARQVARAVDHLHCNGIVHRDLKPRNILLRSDDAPCLIDFALAARVGAPTPAGGGTAAYRRRTATGEAGATGEADATDEACVADDVYALAVVVYELWTGALPYGQNPTRSNGARRREFPELRPVPGVRGLNHLADVLSDILNERDSALDSGIRPLRHALESVGSNH